jgi:hypothetical protein
MLMITNQSRVVTLMLLSLGLVFVSNAQDRGDGPADATSKLATLYAFDPIQSSICFNDSGVGYVLRENRVFNRCSHLAFNIYQKDSITAGIQGGERGYIVDLGDAKTLKQKYGYEETVGNSQGYASLHVADETVVVLKNYKEQSYQPLREAKTLFNDADEQSSAPVNLGHIYLVRIKRKEPAKDILIKALIVAYRPGESVVLRWSQL